MVTCPSDHWRFKWIRTDKADWIEKTSVLKRAVLMGYRSLMMVSATLLMRRQPTGLDQSSAVNSWKNTTRVP